MFSELDWAVAVSDKCVSLSRPDDAIESRLTLVDLAGSERLKETFATGKTMKESIGINRSLFVLRKVITALASAGDAHGYAVTRDGCCPMPASQRLDAGQGESTSVACARTLPRLETDVVAHALSGRQLCDVDAGVPLSE